MQDHNFEKQVQHKMEELSFTPSAPVWQNVQKEIQQKRKRRIGFFWLLPLLIATGAAIWFGVDNNTTDKIDTTAAQTNSTTTLQKVQAPSATTINNNDTKEDQTKGFEKVAAIAPKEKVPVTKKQLSNASLPNHTFKNEMVVAAKKKTTAEKDAYSSLSKNNTPNINNTGNGIQNTNEPEPNSNSTNNSLHTNTQTSITDSLTSITNNGQTVEDSVQNTTATDTLAIVNSNNKKWKWSAYAHTGFSGISTKSISLASASRDYMLADPLQNSAGFSQRPPSAIHRGASFAMGANATKKINKTLAVTVGLQYHYYSTWQYVGQKETNDTTLFLFSDSRTVSDYYRNNSHTSQYTNAYHFIEAPIGLEVSLLKNKKLKWQTGVSAGYLLHTNALTFNRQARIYYNDKESYNKLYLSLHSGLTYKAFNIGNAGVYIGPYVQFNTTNFLKEATGGKQHLYFAALSAKIAFE